MNLKYNNIIIDSVYVLVFFLIVLEYHIMRVSSPLKLKYVIIKSTEILRYSFFFIKCRRVKLLWNLTVYWKFWLIKSDITNFKILNQYQYLNYYLFLFTLDKNNNNIIIKIDSLVQDLIIYWWYAYFQIG